MHQALYRKWRPVSFDDVVGQEYTTTTLKNEIREGHPAHAYLLMGSRGTGKTTCAKLIAKAVNCLNPKDGNPCGECSICKGIDNGSITDVEEIDAATYTGIDNIRELREEAMFMPAVTKYRVFILDEAHMLSGSSVNALLKIVEEPPEHVIFILATTEPHKMPATLQSRCQRFEFKRISTDVIADRLMYVAQQENLDMDSDAASLIAKLADGGMRDALSMLDICAAQGEKITASLAASVTGLAADTSLFGLADAVHDHDTGRALHILDDISKSIEQDRLCSQLITHYRNLLASKVSDKPSDIIICMPETLERYKEQSEMYNLDEIMFCIKVLIDAQSSMQKAQSRRVIMETSFAKMCNPSLLDNSSALVSRIAALERALANVETVKIKNTSETPAAVKTESDRKNSIVKPADNNGSNESATTDEEQLFDKWDEVLNEIKETNTGLAVTLEGTRAYVSGKYILIECNPVFREMIRSSEYAKNSLKDAIAKVTGIKYAIGPYNKKDSVPDSNKNTAEAQIIADATAAGIEIKYE